MRLTRLATLVLVLASSACTARYTQSSYADTALADAATATSVEGGWYFWDGELGGKRADVGVIGVYQKFDFYTDATATYLDARIRWFPTESEGIQPFIGGGLGIYRLSRAESVFNCRGSSICLADQFDQRGQATGLGPHAVLGAEYPLPGRPLGFVGSVTREIAGSDPEWDLGAWRFSVGMFYRPSN